MFLRFCGFHKILLIVSKIYNSLAFQHFKFCMATIRKIALIHFTHGVQAPLGWPCCVLGNTLTKMKRLLQGCSLVAATMQQSNVYATTGGDKVAN